MTGIARNDESRSAFGPIGEHAWPELFDKPGSGFFLFLLTHSGTKEENK